eukprot:6909068-Prymnesium_polylepis.1
MVRTGHKTRYSLLVGALGVVYQFAHGRGDLACTAAPCSIVSGVCLHCNRSSPPRDRRRRQGEREGGEGARQWRDA